MAVAGVPRVVLAPHASTPARVSRVQIPNGWTPRAYQRNAWAYLEGGGTRAVEVWHRRSGKDSKALNWTAAASHMRKGVYWHLLPEAEQARKAVWNGIDAKSRRIIDQVFPPEIRKSTSSNEMRIELKCGSIWQLAGSDNYNSLVGSNPCGVVFSEFALSKPSAWDYIRPILNENGGWALFNMTPRGLNHGWDLLQMARANHKWFAEVLTVDDTRRDDGTPVIGPEQIQEERDSGMAEEMIEQEYFCSFEAANIGAYYGKQMRKAEAEGRIGEWPWMPEREVFTAWDIGRSDDTSIWWFQVVGGSLRVIDFHSSNGGDVPFYVGILRGERYENDACWEQRSRYRYSAVPLWLPHDGEAQTFISPRSAQQQFSAAGFKSRICPRLSIQDGIQAARETLIRATMDRKACGDGVTALKLYQRHWNDDKKCFEDRPHHDWTSHPADGFRMMAVAWRKEMEPQAAPDAKAIELLQKVSFDRLLAANTRAQRERI